MKGFRLVFLICGIALFFSACSTPDKFAGTYVGHASVEHETSQGSGDTFQTSKSEKRIDDVSMVLKGNSDKDFVLFLTAGENSPVKNCTMRIRNEFLSAVTSGSKAKDDKDPILNTGLSEDFEGNKNDHTCEMESGGSFQRITFRTGSVSVYEGAMTVKFDTLPSNGTSKQFEFVGATSKEAMQKYKEKWERK